MLLAEDGNPHDPSAVSVWIDGLLVGYLPRDQASALRPALLTAQEREGKPIALKDVIVKGAMRGDGGSRLSVLDEPEGLKDRGPDKRRRWRARYTLAVLARIFPGSNRPGVLRGPAADGTHCAVFMELLFDPPRHERLPNNDDEIIDRALGAQGLVGTAITFLTFDTNQAEKARRAGLKVKKLIEPVGEEPEDPRHKERKQPEANGRSA